jgi:hypothetical protein
MLTSTAFRVALAALALNDEPPQSSPLGEVVTRLARENGHSDPLAIVMTHLTQVPRRHGVSRKLSRVVSMFTDPWSGPVHAAELRDRMLAPFANPKAVQFDGVAQTVIDWLDAAEDDLDDDARALLAAIDTAWAGVVDVDATEAVLMERLAVFCDAVADAVDRALADFDPDERARFFATAPAILEGWYRNHFPKVEVAPELGEALSGGFALLPRIEPPLLLGAARRALRISDSEFTSTIGKRLSKLRRDPKTPLPPGFSGDILAVSGTSDRDRVVLGGPQKSTYAAHAALIIDVGGNDVFERAAVADGEGRPFAAVIDLNGNDTWRQRDAAAGPCAAIGGIAILVDRAGKDTYAGKRLALGASIGGFAFLFDQDGNDTYAMEDFGQGCGVYGVGLAFDSAGNDTRDAWAFAQGASLGVGFGACVDDAGDDSYLADLNWPDVYGDSGPDSFHGASQGYSTGIRPATPGGVGVLIDRLGKDRYQSGNFSQGGAYYFAFGLMYDGGGDDQNQGYRYSQGFGVHEAVGIRWDAGGNDRYVTKCAANLGSAWDEGIGFFFDDLGDDDYQMSSLGLGGAANSAIAIFVDGDGKDRYQGGGAESQGGAGDRSYYNEPSLSLLLDLGGDADTYSREGRKDDTLATDGGVALFLDSKKKTLSDLLAAPRVGP